MIIIAGGIVLAVLFLILLPLMPILFFVALIGFPSF